VALGGFASPASASDADQSDRALPDVTADDVFSMLIRKVNHGQRAQARKLASKQVVRVMFKARDQGYRFDRPRSECVQNEDKPANRYECETAHHFGEQLTGSVFVVIKDLDDGLKAVRADVFYGE
jgi:hypothetical protein